MVILELINDSYELAVFLIWTPILCFILENVYFHDNSEW